MHVRRKRRRDKADRFTRSAGSRIRVIAAGAATLALAGGGMAYASTEAFGTSQVGQTTGQGTVLPSDQNVKPIGDRLLVDNGKLLASTISPDGRHLAALTTDAAIALTIVDLQTYKVIQQAGTSPTADLRISNNNVGQEGPTYSPDGKTLWMPQINGYDRFPVNADGTVGAPTFIAIPADGAKHATPAQAVYSPDGSTLYAAVNGQNRVVAMNPTTGVIQHSWAVGRAPRDLVLVGGKLYVSNEGGRPAKAGDSTLDSYGTQVPADPDTGATTTGTVSVIDVADPSADIDSIDVGLHPTALHAANGALFVTDTGSDHVSVIDTSTEKVVQTITTQPWPKAEVGYHPNGVTLTKDGHLLVTLGRANALAVYRYTSPQEPVSYVGLLPTDYYPENVTTVGDKVLVTNLRGIGARGPERTIAKGPGTEPATGHNTHASTGTLQRFALPDDSVIADGTDTVVHQNGWDDTSVEKRDGGNVPPVAVPQRLGDPSTIKHVFLLVKENRSYDQVFGDDPRGNGDPSLAQFGANVTPNQHALAQQFGLYDNTYDVGTNSAEGHNWLMQADNPEYTESQAGEYERSYGSNNDALGHQRSGFIWTGAKAAGKSARVFGEYNPTMTDPAGTTWQDYYCDYKNMAETGADTAISTSTSSPIPSLNDITVHKYPHFDTGIPDQYRYEIWKRDFDANGPAHLNMMWLSSDHTGGPPNPIAQVADNDLAVGKVVDHISHSKYWKDSAIFVIEDDTQNGVDHIDGARGPVQIISPWARHGVIDSHYYTQITVIRTIEQILGITPMNQKDSAATPMHRAFTQAADYTPFKAVPNRIPLTYGLSTQPNCGSDEVAPKYAPLAPAQAPVAVPADKQHVADLWRAWKKQQHLTGPKAAPDYANPEQMDHFTWYEAHGWRTPYPGEHKILSPAELPGRYLPSPDSDG
ncbi:40-residue YVTN family beta-propeller repeat-containing protein [Actinopolymorpha cephalotaxi]|uniref:40-residue YVTN family beta-propeller repeat-containing protein n=1 Tax=Actinopolymorpha cephalotaxi TaxID=504797 RepID=A0A1I2SW87_9ACTN|nr:bifunctional YncE family protein/alkaline phosphatase family protein [Actinopolymorpha cephalotaxi]NYH84046.1 YVTN family beta-propeller protein [Actinopolymorpha cephalotaxi]SFG54416.1 40-residue YVTN family beta-propeller repeat-containing protein [Actinopolymorpha cephalotaxi]